MSVVTGHQRIFTSFASCNRRLGRRRTRTADGVRLLVRHGKFVDQALQAKRFFKAIEVLALDILHSAPSPAPLRPGICVSTRYQSGRLAGTRANGARRR